MTHAFTYPRLAAYGVRHVDGYGTWTTDFGYNGAFGTAYSVESAVWDPEQASYEGGFLAVNGAGCLDMVNLSHGLRGMPSDYEPTFKIVSGDTNFSRYGIRISGHTGVEIEGGAPILPGPGGSVSAIAKPAFIYIDGANLVVIRNTIPHAGTYKSADEYSALIKTTGVVGNVIVDGLNIAQLGQGYIFDVGHNANTGRIGFQPTDDFLRVGNFSGYVRDTAAIKLMTGGTDRITGAVDVFTPTIISEASTPYNPTFGGIGGTPSVSVKIAKYRRRGKAVRVRLDCTVANVNGASSVLTATLPFASNGEWCAGFVAYNATTGAPLMCRLGPNSPWVEIYNMTNSFPVTANGQQLVIEGEYEAA